MVFGISSVTMKPDSLPKGASVNDYDGDHHFMQAIEFTLDGGGTWDEDDNISITIPTGISLADVDGDGSYSDAVSVSWALTSSLAGSYSIEAATAQSIIVNFGTDATGISSGDLVTFIFPITTSLNPSADSLGYRIQTISDDGDQGETVNDTTVYVQFSRKVNINNTEFLDLLTFATDYDGSTGDSTDTQGQYYPRSAAAAVLSVALPDLVTDRTDASNNGDVINGVDTEFESITLDNSDANEVTYYIWASTRDSLQKIDAEDSDVLQALQISGSQSLQATDNEDGTFANIRLDATIYEEDTWYFYVTSSLTSDWVLGRSGAVKVTHRPTFSTTNGQNTAIGVDYDNDFLVEPTGATPTGDDAATVYLDGSGALDRDGTIGDPGDLQDVDTLGIYYSVIDYDDEPTIQFFRSTTSGLTADSLYTSGTSPIITIDSLAGATELTLSPLTADESYKFYYYDPVRSSSDYDAANTYYIYAVANDGNSQVVRQVKDNSGTNLTLYLKYFPKFYFDDEYYSSFYSSNQYTFNTHDEQYYVVNWGQVITGDEDIDGNMTIKLYASDLEWAQAGGSQTVSSVDTSLLPTDAADDPDGTVLIATIYDTSDTKEANRYMWDVRNSGLAAGTYSIYAVVTSPGSSGRDAAVVTLNEGESMLEGTQRLVNIVHGAHFLPKTPVEGEVVELDRGDSYEFRWESFDMDATSGEQIVSAFMVPTGTSVASTVSWSVATNYSTTNYYWLFPTSGNGQDMRFSAFDDDVEPATNKKFTLRVSDIYVDMGGNNSGVTAPTSGTYDVYYFFASDGTFGYEETINKADGQLYFSANANTNDDYNFRIEPTKTVVEKGDTTTFSVIAYHSGISPMAMNVYLNIPSENIGIVDQDTTTDGTQPYVEITSPFNGAVTKDSLVTSGGVHQLEFETHTSNYAGVSMTTADTIATFQIFAKDNAKSDVLEDVQITFNTTGSRITRMLDDNFVDFGYSVPSVASKIRLTPRGKITGYVDLQGVDQDSGIVVTFYLTPRGSYNNITDSIFVNSNTDTVISDGIDYTLGENGTYTFTHIPAGQYDLLCTRDGWLTQREDSVTVQAHSTTSFDFDNADELKAGDCGGYDHDGLSTTTTLPDNQINATDYEVLEACFDTDTSDASFHQYCDFDGDSTITLYDLQWPAINTGVGVTSEGIQYKVVNEEGQEPLARIQLVDEEDGEYTYQVVTENFPLLHCFDVRIQIDREQWDLLSANSLMKSPRKRFFIKRKGNLHLFVAATLGDQVSEEMNQTLFQFTLKKLVDEPSVAPKVQEVLLLNVYHVANTPVISIDIEDNRKIIPESYELSQNYPNPFNPTTNIRFALPEKGDVKLTIYNMLGQKVRTLVKTKMDAGYYKVAWNGKSDAGMNVASGMYFYKIDVNNKFIKTKKMIMLK
jgi:hypothetical protein